MNQVLRGRTKPCYIKVNLFLQIYLILPVFLATCFLIGLIMDELYVDFNAQKIIWEEFLNVPVFDSLFS